LKLSKVLVLHKKSTFQLQAIERRESRFVKLLEEGNEVVTRVKLAHDEHIDALKHVEEELTRRQIDFKRIVRSALKEPVTGVDLMISVGGDGTFLDASHFLTDVPLLGVNSSQSSSFGHFCQASEKNLARILDDIESDKIEPAKILRLEATLQGKQLPTLVLNEVLVAHANPAATSRHITELHGIIEEQRSSGIWIATAAGSTGSMRSAEGIVLPILDRRFQYIVREPCMRPNENWQLIKGILDENESIKIKSQMRTGAIFLDGSHINHHFYLGDELIIKPSRKYLNAFIAENVNDIFI